LIENQSATLSQGRKDMRAIILAVIASILITGIADAQLRVPAGCFVTDAERELYSPLPDCFNEQRAVYIPFNMGNGYSAEEIVSFYGWQYGFEVNASYDLFTKWQDAENRATANGDSSNVHYGWYVAEFNKNKQLKKLEARLRKACGSKCKKIKTIKAFSDDGSSSDKKEPLPTASGNPMSMSFEQHLQQSR
jgi:hypothetical protein